jgi:hypothetical protein
LPDEKFYQNATASGILNRLLGGGDLLKAKIKTLSAASFLKRKEAKEL